jgi:hypothetical protein
VLYFLKRAIEIMGFPVTDASDSEPPPPWHGESFDLSPLPFDLSTVSRSTMPPETLTPSSYPTARLPPSPPPSERDLLAAQLRGLAAAVKMGTRDVASIRKMLSSL